MAQGTDDDRWLVDLLEIQPADHVLEVGSGPGVALELMAARATHGLVAGVDPSDVMVRQARRRNWAAVQDGRVVLHQGTVAALPYADAFFTKALALHSIYFWPSIEEGVRELHRVLRPGGRLAIGVRMHRPQAGRFNPARYGLTAHQLAEIRSVLDAVGFADMQTRQRDLGRETVTALVARRP